MRFHRSLFLYFKTQINSDVDKLDFFHNQLSIAVKSRYFSDRNKTKFHILQNLGIFYKNLCDKNSHLQYNDYLYSENGFVELCYIYIYSLNLDGIRQTLGNLNYIKKRFEMGQSSIEKLLRDFTEAITLYQELSPVDLKYVKSLYPWYSRKEMLEVRSIYI